MITDRGSWPRSRERTRACGGRKPSWSDSEGDARRKDEIIAELRREGRADRGRRDRDLIPQADDQLGAPADRKAADDQSRRQQNLIPPGAGAAEPVGVVDLELGPQNLPQMIL